MFYRFQVIGTLQVPITLAQNLLRNNSTLSTNKHLHKVHMIQLDDIKKLKTHNISSNGIISKDKFPTPNTYLQYAIADLHSDPQKSSSDLHSDPTKRSIVNAVSNAKRALHMQVDLLSEALGIEHMKRPKNFPLKIEFCGKCGIVGKRILKKLNKLRNTVEHNYYVPEREEAEDYVDIVELFINATNKLMYSFPTKVELESTSSFEKIGVTNVSVVLLIEVKTGIITVKRRTLNKTWEEIQHRFIERVKVILDEDLIINQFIESMMDSLETVGLASLPKDEKRKIIQKTHTAIIEKQNTRTYKADFISINDLKDSYHAYITETKLPEPDWTTYKLMKDTAYDLSDYDEVQYSIKDNETEYCKWISFIIGLVSP